MPTDLSAQPELRRSTRPGAPTVDPGLVVEQAGELGRVPRAGEPLTLGSIATKLQQLVQLTAGLHAFGDYRQPERVTEADDRGDDR